MILRVYYGIYLHLIRYAIKQYMILLKIRRNNTIFQIDPCFFAKVMHVSRHWVQSQPQVFDESSGGNLPHPNKSTLNPQDCRKKLMDSTVLDRLYENLFTFNQTYYMDMFSFPRTHSLPTFFRQIVSRYTSEVAHFSRMIQRSRNVWAYQHFWSPALAHFLLDPSRTLKVQQVIYWIWKWRVEYYSKLDISSYPFLLISNELWPTAQVLLFLQDGLNLLQVSLAWYRWSLWDADSWPRVVQKNHVFTMESKVRSAEVTYPREV